MKVYEGDDRPDKHGEHPLRFTGYRNIGEVHEWLYQHYAGYHFVIILDETKDEFEPFGKELLVYFTDTVLEELAYQYDYELKKRGGT